jgi:diguanylate cyclase (GGDEF)-like protein
MIGCVNEIGTKQKADNVSGLLGQTSLQTYLYEYHSFFPDGYMLRLGLDDFKDINENFGMEYGDKIIRRTAQCISECIKPGQMLYKIVADEFFIVDFLNGTSEDAAELYHKIRQSLGQFVDDNEYQTVVTISGGVLECNKIEDHSFSNIMKLSEFALNEAKRKGKNRHYVYKEEDYQKLLRKKEMTQIIRQAVKNDFEGFEAYFQPLFSFDTDTLYGAETLMRFHTEKYGMVSPVEFVPILEETGLIIPAGRWIMQQALEACKKIQYILPGFHISINVSYIQVMKGDIINELTDAVSSLEIPPSSVIVELTDSGEMPTDSRFSKLWELLKESGILIALDNFGTGYSNFHSLYDLRPDIIKIDHFFTAKALQNDYDFTLLSLMTQLAHNLDLKICVEGIENEKARQDIIPLLPDYCQGFLSGRPCSYEDFIEQFVNVTR